MAVKPAKFLTADQHAYEHIKEAILRGELRGGERLDQDEIARELGLSRMPVREAIKRLDSEGLVVNVPRRGAMVTALSPDAVLEIFEMRAVLEGLLVSTAMRSMSESASRTFVNELEARLRRLERAGSGPAGVWIQRHDEFHQHICRAAGRPRAADLIDRLRQGVSPYIRLYLSTHREAEMPGFEHQTLLNAIAAGDPAHAEAMMRDHVMSAADGVIEFLRRVPSPASASGTARARGPRKAARSSSDGPVDRKRRIGSSAARGRS